MKNKYNIATREYIGETEKGNPFKFIGYAKGEIRRGFEEATDKKEAVILKMEVNPAETFLCCSLRCMVSGQMRQTEFQMHITPEDLKNSNRWRALLSICEKRLKVMTLGLQDAEDETDELEEIEKIQEAESRKRSAGSPAPNPKSIPEQVSQIKEYTSDPDYLETPGPMQSVWAVLFYSGFETITDREIILAKIYPKNKFKKVMEIPAGAKSYFFDLIEGFQGNDNRGSDRTQADRQKIRAGLRSLVEDKCKV